MATDDEIAEFRRLIEATFAECKTQYPSSRSVKLISVDFDDDGEVMVAISLRFRPYSTGLLTAFCSFLEWLGGVVVLRLCRLAIRPRA